MVIMARRYPLPAARRLLPEGSEPGHPARPEGRELELKARELEQRDRELDQGDRGLDQQDRALDLKQEENELERSALKVKLLQVVVFAAGALVAAAVKWAPVGPPSQPTPRQSTPPAVTAPWQQDFVPWLRPLEEWIQESPHPAERTKPRTDPSATKPLPSV